MGSVIAFWYITMHQSGGGKNQDEIPAEYVISVMTTENALQQLNVNKAVRPDNVPAWVLRDNARTLAAPLTALFNTSLRDGVIPALWKTAHVIPLPKKKPPRSIEKDIRPISLTPIVSKIFESIVMKWVDHKLFWKIKLTINNLEAVLVRPLRTRWLR